MTPDFGGRPFSLSHYLAIKSAREIIRPDCIILHCAYEPQGEWWEKARQLVHVHHVRPISGIYGFPATHPAHRADIIRLAALTAIGGIYLDTDVLVVRPFDNLLSSSFAAALEVTDDQIVVGLSNAVLLAQPEAEFTKLCLEGHDPRKSLWQGFRSSGRDHNYVEMSVRYPLHLADLSPDLLEVLPSKTFLWAGWSERGLKTLFEEYHDLPTGVLALHLWESHAWDKYLRNLTPDRIFSESTTYNVWARQFLADNTPSTESDRLIKPNLRDLGKMDEICRAVDFIMPRHESKESIGGRLAYRAKNAIKYLPYALQLPLRSVCDQLKNHSGAEENSLGGIPPLQKKEGRYGKHRAKRLAEGDDSRKILQAHLLTTQERDITFLMVTCSDFEPSACAWMASLPNVKGLWVSESLSRANELACWSEKSESQVRCIYQSNKSPSLLRLLERKLISPAPTVCLLAGTSLLKRISESMEINAEFIFIIKNSESKKLDIRNAKSEGKNQFNEDIPESQLMQLARLKGYKLIDQSTEKSTFLFKIETSDLCRKKDEKHPSSSPFLKVTTLYNQRFHLSQQFNSLNK